MANLKLADWWDGDTGPTFVFEMRDENGNPINTSSAALSLRIVDDVTGATLSTLAGEPALPRSDGIVYVNLKGKEADWAGKGRQLLAHPKIYVATAPDGSLAQNLLLNGSLDNDSDLDGVPDSWTRQSVTGTNYLYSVGTDDPAPPVVFGGRLAVLHTASGDTDYLKQLVTVSLQPGDYISGWVWHRASLLPGATVLGGGGFYLEIPSVGGSGNLRTTFPTTDTDWHLTTVSGRLVSSATQAALHLVCFDAVGYQNRFDDACLFRGQIGVTQPDYFVLPVRPRTRATLTSTTALTEGVGSFDSDSDGDGFPDGWSNQAPSVTFSVDPTVVQPSGFSSASLKAVMTGGSGNFIRLISRGSYKVGERWRARVFYKTSGTLTGSPTAGTFGVGISTEMFDGPVESAVSTNFSMTQTGALSTTVQATLTLANEHNALVLDVNLNGATGTMWLDDFQLFQI